PCEGTREGREGRSRDSRVLLHRGAGPVPDRVRAQEQVQAGRRPRGIPAVALAPESKTRPDAGAGRTRSRGYVCRRGTYPQEPPRHGGEAVRNEVRFS